jgi:hypothetical protein
LAKAKHDNLKMLRQIRKEISSELEKMTPEQRQEFFKGAEELYEGLKKMEKVRAAIAR